MAPCFVWLYKMYMYYVQSFQNKIGIRFLKYLIYKNSWDAIIPRITTVFILTLTVKSNLNCNNNFSWHLYNNAFSFTNVCMWIQLKKGLCINVNANTLKAVFKSPHYLISDIRSLHLKNCLEYIIQMTLTFFYWF